MRIAQVCHRYKPILGGVSTYVSQISESLAGRHEIVVLTTDPSGQLPKEETMNGVSVRRFRSYAPSGAYYYSEGLRKYLTRHSDEFDLVHAHNYHAFPALYAGLAKRSNPLVFTPHYFGRGVTAFRNVLHVPYRQIAKRVIFGRCDKVICVSEYEMKLVVRDFGVDQKKVTVMPIGVNLGQLAGLKRTSNQLRRRIMFGGRLVPPKNLDKLIDSMRILLDEHGVDVELKIIGSGCMKEKLERLIKKRMLENRVTICRPLPRKEYLVEVGSSDVFVMPSEYECYGIAAAEAIAIGVPTVVSDSTALREFVGPGLAIGISLPVTPRSIATSIYRALSSGQVIGERASNTGTAGVELSDRLVRVYSEVECEWNSRKTWNGKARTRHTLSES